MNFFSKAGSKAYTIIIGCGRLGANLANVLSNEGENVLIMDSNKESFSRLASNFGGLAVVGDGTDIDKLREAEIEKASAVIAVTNEDNTNIMIAQLVREIFKVECVIARLYNPECDMVYQKLGINTICPTVLAANAINTLLVGALEKEEVL